MDQREMVQASLNAEHDHGVYTRRKGQRRVLPGRREEDQYYPTRGIVTEPPTPERMAELQAIAEQFRTSAAHGVSPNRQGWRARLVHIEARMARADDLLLGQVRARIPNEDAYRETDDDERLMNAAAEVVEALAEVRAMIDENGRDHAG